MRFREEPIEAKKIQDIIDWLRDHGFSGAEFGAALAEINKCRDRYLLTVAVLNMLGMTEEDIRAWSIR